MRGVDADVLIAGGGLAAQRCCETLRRLGFDGRILVLCEEPRAPYDRPPLSKAALTHGRELQRLAFKPLRWYAERDVKLLPGLAARDLDPLARTIALRDGDGLGAGRLRYRALVIATGSRPRRLRGLPLGRVVYELRTHPDAQALRARLRDQGRLLVLGAGLIGLEVASSARALGTEVTLIEATATPLARALPPALGHWIAGLHRAHGIDVRLGTAVERVTLLGNAARLQLSDGAVLGADTVLAAVGSVPATEWLAACGLGPGAIPTDLRGRTGVPGVYAAGDAASFPDPDTGARMPTQHWEAAARQGATVARAIVGLEPLPASPPMFWSDQHGHRLQLVGHPTPDCRVEIEGDPARAGSYAAWITRGERPAAALLVDRPGALSDARRWIAGHPREHEDGRGVRDAPPTRTRNEV